MTFERAATTTPEPGLYRVRLTKLGAYVAARIEYGPSLNPDDGTPLDRSWFWSADIDGESDPDPAPAPSERVMRVWLWGERIDRATFDYLLADAEWARRHKPDDPRAQPKRRGELGKMEPITP